MNTILISLEAERNTRTHDFTVSFNRPIDISDGMYYIALEKLNLWYSFYNIAAKFDNNYLSYYNGSVWKLVTFPDGQYTIDQINDFVHAEMVNNGDGPSVDPLTGQIVYDVNILPDYSTLRVVIQVSNGRQVDLMSGEMHRLLGFERMIVTTTQEGKHVANLNRDINTLQLHCDIGSATYLNRDTTDILYTFVPNGFPGSNLEIIPQHHIFVPIRVPKQINRIRIYITDQEQRSVDLNGEPVSVLLTLKRFN